MQIHELNNKSTNNSQLNEVDLVGPSSVFGTAKQVLKNPAALYKSSALGSAQAAATQASAQKSAAKLASQGYSVGGSVQPAVTINQQLQAVQTNPAVQQQIKNLTAQWMAQSAAIKKATQTAQAAQPATTQPTKVAEAVAVFDPKDLSDPKYATVLRAIQNKLGKPAEPTPAETNAKNVELEKKLSDWKVQFRTWSDPRLQAGNITINQISKDPAIGKMLDSKLSNVVVAAQSGDMNLEQRAVQEYFNAAIAAIQMYERNTQSQSRVAAPSGAAAPAAAGEEQQVAQQLEQLGISKTAIASLGKLMKQSSRGNSAINDTGNPLLNAIAKLAGMTVR